MVLLNKLICRPFQTFHPVPSQVSSAKLTVSNSLKSNRCMLLIIAQRMTAASAEGQPHVLGEAVRPHIRVTFPPAVGQCSLLPGYMRGLRGEWSSTAPISLPQIRMSLDGKLASMRRRATWTTAESCSNLCNIFGHMGL